MTPYPRSRSLAAVAVLAAAFAGMPPGFGQVAELATRPGAPEHRPPPPPPRDRRADLAALEAAEAKRARRRARNQRNAQGMTP